MSFVQERERRANAGNRMRALLNQEVEMEELFEYNENEQDEEFSTQAIEEEEDKLDSDFDLDSSEGEQEHINEGKAMDIELILEEKRARRVTTSAFNPSVTKSKEPVERKARQRKPKLDPEERSTRYSSRKNTVLNRILIEDQLRENEKRKASQPKRFRKVQQKLTQDELLAEAALTEEMNKNSLLEWQQKEAERKENARKMDKKQITGPFVRYHSFADHLSSEGVDNLMGRTLISFIDNTKDNVDYMDLEKDANLELTDLIEELSEWRKKKPKPNRPVLCPITCDVAKYCDPNTNIPYSSITAYDMINKCLNHEMNWSSELGAYLGQIPSANGVPEGWDTAI